MVDVHARVAIIGEENVGKSSLLNALLGEEASIVTSLAGTTRDQIRGYVYENSSVLEVSDTPGMHHGNTLLGRHMRKSISNAVQNADIILYVLDAERFGDADIEKISNYREKGIPVIVAVNKTDRVRPERLVQKLSCLNKLDFVKSIVPICAKTGENLDILLGEISKFVDQGAASATEPEIFTDQSVKKMASEIIRAEIIRETRDEIPHGVAVVITKFAESAALVEIEADILCEKASHKPIIIGKRGGILLKVGTNARALIEKLVAAHVRLNLHVIVRPNWKNDKDFFDLN